MLRFKRPAERTSEREFSLPIEKSPELNPTNLPDVPKKLPDISIPSYTPDLLPTVLSTPDTKDQKFHLSFEERMKNYMTIRNRIFNESIPKKVKRLREMRARFKTKKNVTKELEEMSEINSYFKDCRPNVVVDIEGTKIRGLLDSGASVSALGRNSLKLLSHLQKTFHSLKTFVKTADGKNQNVIGYVCLLVSYNGVIKTHRFVIVPSLDKELYLGFDFWKAYGIAPELHSLSEICNLSLDIECDKPESNMHQLSTEQSVRLQEVVDTFPSSFKNGLGHTSYIQHRIDTESAEPINSKHYPVSPKVQELMYEELDRMLRLGVIEEAESPWNSPVVLVRKPGKNRLCLDSRKLNSVTKKLAYALPNINGLLSRLADTVYISCIDLKDAFWQVELHPDSKEKTAFTVPGRPQYQFRVMPFGLCNAAQRLCQLMDRVFPTVLRSNVSVYLDDLLVVSATFDEHLQTLNEVAERLKTAGLTVNIEKSRFCYTEVRYLGHIIGHGTIKPDPEKISAIVNFTIPKTAKQVRRFMGMCGYYGKFIDQYSSISSALTDTISKKNKFQMTPEALESFEKLKKILTSEPVLVHPDFSKAFSIHCDASRHGVGACLMQEDCNGDENPICYFSKKLNKAQRNYSITELECLAAVLAVEKFRPYVELHPFTIITDHSSLKWLMSQRDLNGRLARWSLRLQKYEFSIKHRKGHLNVVPDTLSREDDISAINMPAVDLTHAQFQSEEYKELVKILSENADKMPDINIVDGIVYKRMKPRNGFVDEEKNLWRIWLPKDLAEEVVEKAHVSDDSNHCGNAKTIAKIRQYYDWPKLNSQVSTYIENCDRCKERKPANQTLRTPMGESFTVQRPFQHIYMDFIGPYPRSKSGHTHVIVVLDQLTKYPVFVPLRHANASLVCEFLERDVFSTYNVPETVYTDNASQFKSKLFQDFLEMYGVRHLTPPSYSPQSNASERLNKEIVYGINMQLENDQTKWVESLNKIAFSLRSTVHQTIGYSPHYALFGQDMICHGSSYKLLKQLDALAENDLQVQYHPDKMSKLHENLMDNIQKAHGKFEKHYNLRSRVRTFTPGQTVYRRLFHLSDASKSFNSKLAPKFAKCKVKSKVSDNRYLLEDLKGKELGTFHTKDIKT